MAALFEADKAKHKIQYKIQSKYKGKVYENKFNINIKLWLVHQMGSG